MAAQMQKVISNCEQCIQHGGICSKAPVWPIIVTAPLELLHIDFTSIETTMELDQPQNMVNLLVFCDHFTKHVMAYVTPDQTAKTVAKFLWQGYILIFRAPAKLLSDWGANFESNIIRELCKLMGIWKFRTSPYQWTGEMSSPNADVHDREIKYGPEGRLGESFTQIGACLQLYEIGHHKIQPALFDVWMLAVLTHWLLFPHNKGQEKTPVCWPLHCQVMWTAVESL